MRVENVLNLSGQGTNVNISKSGDFLAVLLQVLDETLGYKENNLVGEQEKERKNIPKNLNFSLIPDLEKLFKGISSLPLKEKTFTKNSKEKENESKYNIIHYFPEVLVFINQFIKIFHENESFFTRKNGIQNFEASAKSLNFRLFSEKLLHFREIGQRKELKNLNFDRSTEEETAKLINFLQKEFKLNKEDKKITPLHKEISFFEDKKVIKEEVPILTNTQDKVYTKQAVKFNDFNEFQITQSKIINREERIKTKKGKEFSPSPGVVVELREWKREELTKVQGSERTFSVKDIRIFEGNEKKSVNVKFEGLGIQMSFIKDGVNLKINLSEVLKNVFLTPYDAIKISQILSSYGFRLESVNVNGSEIYRNREKDKVNIKVNELMGEGINSSNLNGNISILL